MLDYNTLKQIVEGNTAALRCITEFQPVGGQGSKIFPPTYKGGKYATEKRFDPKTGDTIECVLLDSVQSQANRMELALLNTHRAGKISLPLLTVTFDLDKKITITSLDAPHRIADAIFRDSLLGNTPFRESKKGHILDNTDLSNATELFGICPTALLFGMWDSTGLKGGSGVKFQRLIVSEIIGYNVIFGTSTSSRIDPLGIEKQAGPIYEGKDGDWTLNADEAKKDKNGKPIEKSSKDNSTESGRPSIINHGNIPPTIDEKRGATISSAHQTVTLSFTALRRLSFPLNGKRDSEVDNVARTVISALGIAGNVLAQQDMDLRSRCHLIPTHESIWEIVGTSNNTKITITPHDALNTLNESISNAKNIGLPWDEEIKLVPSEKLKKLVEKSQEIRTYESEE